MKQSHFRKRHKYWLARASEAAKPLARLFRKVAARSEPSSPREWRHVILTGTDHIGDILYRTVGLEVLKESFPECKFHFLASQPAADLLAGNPALASILPSLRPFEARSLAERASLISSVGADAVFCYDTGDYWREQLAAALARVPNCAGYTHKGFSGFVTYPLPFRPPQPFAAYFRDSVETLTGRKVSSLRPRVFLNEEDRVNARALRDQLIPVGRAMLVASVTSRQPSHLAIQRRMIATLAELKRRVAVEVVLLGAPGDEPFLRSLAAEAGLQCHYAAGKLTVREAVAFFHLAKVAFCLDSGPRHMANAAGIPVVFCRNLEFLKIEAGCYLETEIDIAPDAELLSYREMKNVPLFPIETGVQNLCKYLV